MLCVASFLVLVNDPAIDFLNTLFLADSNSSQSFNSFLKRNLKVTVQLETEGNCKNKIVNNMDRLSLVYTAQTNPGSTRVKTNPASTRLWLHGQISTTRVNTKLGRTRVSFSHAGQLFAFPGEVIVFCNQAYCFEHSR